MWEPELLHLWGSLWASRWQAFLLGHLVSEDKASSVSCLLWGKSRASDMSAFWRAESKEGSLRNLELLWCNRKAFNLSSHFQPYIWPSSLLRLLPQLFPSPGLIWLNSQDNFQPPWGRGLWLLREWAASCRPLSTLGFCSTFHATWCLWDLTASGRRVNPLVTCLPSDSTCNGHCGPCSVHYYFSCSCLPKTFWNLSSTDMLAFVSCTLIFPLLSS